MFIDIRDRGRSGERREGRGGERETERREKETLA